MRQYLAAFVHPRSTQKGPNGSPLVDHGSCQNESVLFEDLHSRQYDLMRVAPEERKEFERELDHESLNHNKNQLSNFSW
jgi:hypothetical protein